MPPRIRLLVAIALAAALIVPFFLTEIPPVADYPNHLARAYLLAFGKADPALAAMFDPHWQIIPNLATDVVLPPILRLMPTYAAGKLALALSLLLPVLGGWVYSACLFRGWPAWSLGVALVAFNLTFLEGFLNFQIGLGMAFLVAAAWVRWRERQPALAVVVTAAGAIVVFFCHLIALMVLVVLIGAHELDWLLDDRDRRRQVFPHALAVAAVFVLPLALYLLSPTSGAEGRLMWQWEIKPLVILAPFMNYHLGLDTLTGLAVIACVVIASRRRWLVIPRATAISLAIFGAAYLVSPYAIKGGAFFDTRFSIIAGYLLFIGIAEARIPRTVAGGTALGFVLLFAGRMAVLSFAWHEQEGQIAEMREAIQPIPAGSRVLVATQIPPYPNDYWMRTPMVRRIGGVYVANAHLPALILIERHAFWQLLFSSRSQQPIAILPPYDRSTVAEMNWGPPGYNLLAGDWKQPYYRTKFPYLDDWQDRFDYVLLLNAGGVPDRATFLAPRLKLLTDTDVAALYRIDPAAKP